MALKQRFQFVPVICAEFSFVDAVYSEVIADDLSGEGGSASLWSCNEYVVLFVDFRQEI